MINFLTVQNTYHDIQITLCHGYKIIDRANANKIEASKSLTPLIARMLEKNQEDLSSLKFIAANIGPGPFTTLRTVLASVNGLAFATDVPLIGVDSLDALVHEFKSVRPEVLRDIPLVALLNAFNQDVYFAISDENQTQRGCMKAQTLIIELVERFPHDPIQFVGNGTALHKDLIMQTFGARAIIHEPIVEVPAIETIAHMALEKWEKKEGLVEQLLPIYLK